MFGAARPDCLASMTAEPSFVDRVRTKLETSGCCVVLPALPSGRVMTLSELTLPVGLVLDGVLRGCQSA